MEKWKPIIGFEEHYEVSSFGRVRNKHTNYLLKPIKCSNGYFKVCLTYSTKKYALIHRLVATAFLPNPFNLPCVNHIDENKGNNNIENLEWCTVQYNVTYGKNTLVRNHTVYQYSMDNKLIKKWDSLKEASEFLGITYQGISRCCRGLRKSHGGYKWEYAS